MSRGENTGGEHATRNSASRIAILTPFRPSAFAGGVETFNEQLASSIPGIRVFSYRPPETAASTPGMFDKFGLEHPRRAWAVAQDFLREHRANPFDLSICNGLYGWPTTLLPVGIPSIQVYHFTMAGLAEKGLPLRGDRFVTRFASGFFDAIAGRGKDVVAVNDNVLAEVQRFYRFSGRVIPNGVDVRIFQKQDRGRSRTELGLPAHARIGLYVGRAEFAKGFDLLVDVIRSLRDVLFLLVGDCPVSEPNVVVRRRVPHEQMPSVYSAADFLILPSRYEGFNLTILEALACDLPIVVSRSAYPLPEVWEGIGAIVDSVEPMAYVRAIADLPAASGEGVSRERVIARYSLERFAENWRAHIASVLS